MKSFKNFLFEQESSGKEFEDVLGGLLKNSNVIRSVQVNRNVLDIDPIENLGSVDTSLVSSAVQENRDKIKKIYKVDQVRMGKITIDL